MSETLPDNKEEAWSSVQTFLRELKNKESHHKTIGEQMTERSATFDFTFENLDKILDLVKGNLEKLDPKYFAEKCPLSGFVMFVIHNALNYGGLVWDEGTEQWPSIRYKYYQHKQNQLNFI